MKKVNLTTKKVINEVLPKFLKGLKQESLNDLSWTDEALGLRGFGFWKEQDVSVIDSATEVFDGTETYALDEANKIVKGTRGVRLKTQAEFDAEFKALVPPSITKLQAMRALKQVALWDTFNTALQSNQDALDEWNLSPLLYRDNEFVALLAPSLNLTERQLDELFVSGGSL